MSGFVTKTLVADGLTPVRAYGLLRQAAEGSASFLLESVVAGERWGRLSVLGYRPRYEATLLADGEWRLSGDAPIKGPLAGGDPISLARAIFQSDPSVTTPTERLAGAHVGYFGWDLVHAIDKVERWPGAQPPLARFMGGSTVVVFDNFAQTFTIAAYTQDEVDRAEHDLAQTGAVRASIGPASLRRIALPDRTRLPKFDASMNDADYERIVRRAKEYIAAGDAFQIVLARNFRVPRVGRDPFDAYRAMRVLNPSPYMYFLDFPPAPGETTRTQIAGASPETLVRLEGGVMTVRPIAGTRPRGRTPEEDAAREAELMGDPKERAEHVMLIDLGRNDVGRVAEVGSVRLLRNMEIERYSHVMHIVSEVEGRVDPARVPPLEAFRAAFPAGTLSGAPKLRAMQIIRELETRPRGIYGGAVGYLTRSGDFDFAIAIRTAVCRGDHFDVTAGAGIVEASMPYAEATETRNKAQAVLAAIEAAPQGVD
ncbi:anthranilate synthase component I family protein [Pendulispora albinea]|uniref:Anthranilate synthase component 1 n=1 Tax=Pendulispora albinea TaxID=2741071 RepID=A0ABZ2M238_9BACT